MSDELYEQGVRDGHAWGWGQRLGDLRQMSSDDVPGLYNSGFRHGLVVRATANENGHWDTSMISGMQGNRGTHSRLNSARNCECSN